ncbi:hypothetical protein ABK040_001330 [Willaertia magna]
MLLNYEEEFLPKTGGLSFKKQVREVFTARAKDKVKDLQKINPNMIFLIDWDSVLTLPSDLKWKARKEELGVIDNVILYLKFSRKIGYLCSELPTEFCKDPDCKEAFMGLKKMILHIKHNPNDDQSNGFNSHQFSVAGEELHVKRLTNCF